PGAARPPRAYPGDSRQRIQPRYDDRRSARQHGQRSITSEDRRDETDDPLRVAPPLYRLRFGAAVRRRYEERLPLWGDSERKAALDHEEPRDDPQPPRHDLHGGGHFSEGRL